MQTQSRDDIERELRTSMPGWTDSAYGELAEIEVALRANPAAPAPPPSLARLPPPPWVAQ